MATAEDTDQIVVGNLIIDCCRYGVHRGDQFIPLPPTEYRLLLCLVRSKNRILAPDEILGEVWGDHDMVTRPVERTPLRKTISQLRHRIGLDTSWIRATGQPVIESRRGFGYGLFV